MIHTKQELTDLLSTIYQTFNIPIFLLSSNLTIIDFPDEFLHINKAYFTSFVQKENIHQYQIYTCFHQQESYFFFHYPMEDIFYLCIGPVFIRKPTSQEAPSNYPFLQYITSPYTMQDFLNLPYASQQTPKHIVLIYQIITGQLLKTKELKISYQEPITNPLKQENTLNEELFQIRETTTHEFSYSYEQKILNYIQNENSTNARLLMGELLQIKDERHLSKNQIQSMKYKLVCAVAFFTRGVIDVGVPISKAYTLSDIYITKIDNAKQASELHKMISDVITDFTALVKSYKHMQNPYWIKKCKNYISHNLHQQIRLDDLANLVNMNPQYLSTQFKKATGQSLKQYINQKKITEAQFLIKNSDYSLAEISDILQYSNQSHFNKVFKTITGLTPIQYKNYGQTLKD